jgi:transcriptional regulator with XRE-family HTH domain
MSFFSGAKLRQLREARGLSMASVFEMTGVNVSSISNIENGKTDPRMSTVTQLLTCYGAGLGDLEDGPTTVVSLDQFKLRAARSAAALETSEFGKSDPEKRLAHKSKLGLDISVERDALATRR